MVSFSSQTRVTQNKRNVCEKIRHTQSTVYYGTQIEHNIPGNTHRAQYTTEHTQSTVSNGTHIEHSIPQNTNRAQYLTERMYSTVYHNTI